MRYFVITWKVKFNLDTLKTTTTTQPTSTTTVSSSNEDEEEETEVQGETTGTTGWILQNSLNSRFCIYVKIANFNSIIGTDEDEFVVSSNTVSSSFEPVDTTGTIILMSSKGMKIISTR